MGGHVGNAATFLIETLLGIYILIVMLRLLLQWARADFYNPLSQFIVRATQPVLAPMRSALPSVGGIDLACVVLLLALQFAELWLVAGILGHRIAAIAVLVLAVAEIVQLAIYVFLFSILIQVIMSWINPRLLQPLARRAPQPERAAARPGATDRAAHRRARPVADRGDGGAPARRHPARRPASPARGDAGLSRQPRRGPSVLG